MISQFVLFISFALLLTLSLADRPVSLCDGLPTHGDRSTTVNYLVNDDFDQPSLNRSIWHVIQSDNRYTYDFASGRKALSTPANVYLEDGDLIFHAKRETKPSPTNSTVTYKYTTGGITTRNKVLFDIPNSDSFTRICVRALAPTGSIVQDGDKWVDSGGQLWPAFWTLTNNARLMDGPIPVTPQIDSSALFDSNLDQFDEFLGEKYNTNSLLMNREENQSWDEKEPDNYYVCNPDGGEADFFERYGSKADYDVVYHFQRETDQVVCNYPKKHGVVYGTIPIKTDLYHEYAVERGKDSISFFLDGELVKHWTNKNLTKDLPVVFNNTAPWVLFMNLALSGVPGDYFPEEGFKMRIDYVKIVNYTKQNHDLAVSIGVVGILLCFGIAYFVYSKYYRSGENNDARRPLILN
jgi:hypothetical protein